MKKRAALLVATLMSAPLLAAPQTASAEVPISQQVVMRADKKMSATYRQLVYDDSLLGGVYWPSKGNATVRVRSYRLKEKVKKFDYYYVEATVALTKRSGKDSGWVEIQMKNRGAKVYDFAATGGKNGKSKKCRRYPISIGYGWGPISVGTDIGSLTSCKKGPKLRSLKNSKSLSSYRLSDARHVKSFTVQRWVKVAKGKHPKFDVTLSYPRHKCSRYITRRDYGANTKFCVAVDFSSKVVPKWKKRTVGTK